MRLADTQTLNSNLPLEQQIAILQTQIRKIFTCLQGRISFGTGVDGTQSGNIEGEWQSFTVSAGANTEFNVAHTLGSIPLGYLVVSQDKAGNLYQNASTGTAWTSIQISLKSTVDAVTYLIYLIKKGSTTS